MKSWFLGNVATAATERNITVFSWATVGSALFAQSNNSQDNAIFNEARLHIMNRRVVYVQVRAPSSSSSELQLFPIGDSAFKQSIHTVLRFPTKKRVELPPCWKMDICSMLCTTQHRIGGQQMRVVHFDIRLGRSESMRKRELGGGLIRPAIDHHGTGSLAKENTHLHHYKTTRKPKYTVEWERLRKLLLLYYYHGDPSGKEVAPECCGRKRGALALDLQLHINIPVKDK